MGPFEGNPKRVQSSFQQGRQVIGKAFDPIGLTIAGFQPLVFVERHQHVAGTAFGGNHDGITQGLVRNGPPVALDLMSRDA